MNILRVSFSAFNRKENHFAQCFVLIQENIFCISLVYRISVAHNYYICSKVKIDKLIEQLCKKEDGEFWEAYLIAKEKGYSLSTFPDNGNNNMKFYRFPRFGEKDLETAINKLGGEKIPETNKRTPDFKVGNVLFELKDLQEESLSKIERQKNIAELFKLTNDYSINIDPSQDFGQITHSYHRLIKNSIKNHFKTASRQVKEHKKSFEFKNAGIAIFNTGLYSLPHELLKEMVANILTRETLTIQFAFVFSQRMQTNGWDMYAVFASEWIGNVPHEMEQLKGEMDKIVNQRMTEMIFKNDSINIIDSQHPISFEIEDKIFYWNPGQLKFP